MSSVQISTNTNPSGGDNYFLNTVTATCPDANSNNNTELNNTLSVSLSNNGNYNNIINCSMGMKFNSSSPPKFSNISLPKIQNINFTTGYSVSSMNVLYTGGKTNSGNTGNTPPGLYVIMASLTNDSTSSLLITFSTYGSNNTMSSNFSKNWFSVYSEVSNPNTYYTSIISVSNTFYYIYSSDASGNFKSFINSIVTTDSNSNLSLTKPINISSTGLTNFTNWYVSANSVTQISGYAGNNLNPYGKTISYYSGSSTFIGIYNTTSGNGVDVAYGKLSDSGNNISWTSTKFYNITTSVQNIIDCAINNKYLVVAADPILTDPSNNQYYNPVLYYCNYYGNTWNYQVYNPSSVDLQYFQWFNSINYYDSSIPTFIASGASSQLAIITNNDFTSPSGIFIGDPTQGGLYPDAYAGPILNLGIAQISSTAQCNLESGYLFTAYTVAPYNGQYYLTTIDLNNL